MPIVYVVDVGQGSCNIITLGPSPIKGKDGLPAGLRAIIIDCGPSSPNTPAQLLRERNVTWIDALVITHNDRDHCGGLKKIVSYMGGAIDRAFYTCDRKPAGDAKDDIVTTLENFCEPNELGIRQIQNPPKLLARFDDPLHVFPKKGKRLKETDAKLFALSPFGHSSMLVERNNCSTVLRTVIRAVVRRKMHAGPQVGLATTARRGVDADTQGRNSLENCSTLLFYTEGKRNRLSLH